MATERNAVLVRRVIDEIWNGGDLDLADVLFAPTYVNHAGLITDLVQGPEAVKFSVALYRSAFPNLEITVDDLLTDGDTAMLRWTASSIPVSERTGSDANETLSGTTLSHLAGNQVVESWTRWQTESVLQQLGVLTPDWSTGRRS